MLRASRAISHPGSLLRSSNSVMANRKLGPLHGNGIIGIRREDKNEWERRVPICPEHVRQLTRNHSDDRPPLRVIVQPSSTRTFANEDYVAAGAELNEDLSECGTVFAVKEVPSSLLHADKTYMFFSHTIKGQEDNMPLLDVILNRRVRLIDYEKITHSDGDRIVKFGPFAGYAGCVDTFAALGKALLARGFATPFMFISQSKEYRSLDNARRDLRIAGDLIRERGLPAELAPLTFVITSTGSVSQAAQQILHLLPCKYVTPAELRKISEQVATGRPADRHCIYVCVVTARDMVRRIEGGAFDKAEYYSQPHLYEDVFSSTILPYTKVLINAMYWEPRFPRIITTEAAIDLHAKNRFPLMVLADITCDPNGSVQFFTKSTPISDPVYAWDPETGDQLELHEMNSSVRGRSVLVMGVDHLPAEFPAEASTYFGNALLPFVSEIAWNGEASGGTDALCVPLRDAVVAECGTLRPNYKYIDEIREKRRPVKGDKSQRRILILGAGMCAPPAVNHLIANPSNHVTIVDKVPFDRSLLGADKIDAGSGLPGRSTSRRRLATEVVDVTDSEEISRLIADADIVLSLLPAFMHPPVMEMAIAAGRDVVTASYPPVDATKLSDAAESAGTTILHECGLDPGIDIMTSIQLMHSIRHARGKVMSYTSYCGALSAPEDSNNALRYKFSWSPLGVLTACRRPAQFRWGGVDVNVPADMTYNLFRPEDSFSVLPLESIPNGDSMPFIDTFSLHDAATCVRGTFRFKGFAEIARAFVDFGLISLEVNESHKGAKRWGDLMQVKSQTELRDHLVTLLEKRRALLSEFLEQNPVMHTYFAGDSLSGNSSRRVKVDEVLPNRVERTADAIIHEMQMDPEAKLSRAAAQAIASGSVQHALAAHIMSLPQYQFLKGQRDWVLMRHEVIAQYSGGIRKLHTSTMSAHGNPFSGTSATATLVGVPAGVATELLLDGSVQGTGSVYPTIPSIYDPIVAHMEVRVVSHSFRFL